MTLRVLRPASSFLAVIPCVVSCLFPLAASAQSASPAAAQPASSAPGTAADASQQRPPGQWIVRDPRTGRLYQQQIVDVVVPTVQWETKAVTRTVYDPKLVTKNYPQQQIVYVPNTQTVMEPRMKGTWNPFRQPVLSYEFKPATTWVAQPVTVDHPVTTQEWVPRQETIYVPQPVSKMQTRQQLVQVEVPQAGLGVPLSQLAMSRPPLFRLPILAQPPVRPWAPSDQAMRPPATWVNPPAPPSASPPSTVAETSVTGSSVMGLRPITPGRNPLAGLRSSAYGAPLQSASAAAGVTHRDAMQSGMNATVLR